MFRFVIDIFILPHYVSVEIFLHTFPLFRETILRRKKLRGLLSIDLFLLRLEAFFMFSSYNIPANVSFLGDDSFLVHHRLR